MIMGCDFEISREVPVDIANFLIRLTCTSALEVSGTRQVR